MILSNQASLKFHPALPTIQARREWGYSIDKKGKFAGRFRFGGAPGPVAIRFILAGRAAQAGRGTILRGCR
ncbi:hypothetical protein BOSE46_120262 [Bosea sp. 46]|nr:hypothetical protein BOSE46_120262 [Bosea sp. 46]CAD5260801.1 hypothetical protein BOSE21B_110481 [Bosea sp. 21B]VXB51223.1 hypothetical protein BOSE29B_110427 [Bosea sp. 29B]VXB93981.1 hypothetical protein BOSE125_160219 [Bosea sp. 125]VXC83696.1 hypothetical protein BOSE127_60133 [Bosea sp. 127]